MESSIVPQHTEPCITCGTKFKGKYCPQCGEKKLNPSKDYSILKFLEQTLDGFTHFDSKFLRSFKALLSKPGFLTSEFILGRRTRYMKPVQIFIISSVLFYFAFPINSTFYAGVQDMENGNILNYDVTKAIQKKVTDDNLSKPTLIKLINTEAAHRSKAYLFVLIPLWGLVFYLQFFKSVRYLVPHLVFAVHNLSFFILLFLANLSIFFALRIDVTGDQMLIPVGLIYFIYLFIAIRKVYQRNIFWSVLKCTFAFGSFFLLLVVYRQLITAWVLNS